MAFVKYKDMSGILQALLCAVAVGAVSARKQLAVMQAARLWAACLRVSR
jgi:hypothetical protein